MKKISPIFKILSLIFFSGGVLFLHELYLLSIIFILLTALLYLIDKERQVTNRLRMLLPVAIMIVTFQLIFNQSLNIYERLLIGYIVAVKIMVVSIMVLFFMSITSPSEIISGLYFLPSKFKLLLTMTFHFIPAIFNESEKITQVQASRGYKSKIWNISPVIIPLLHRTFQRAHILSLTIVSRGYEE
jgi:energy-coupling factor transporter transmembrane protein EcfT